MKYNPDIHHRRSIRLRGYDYTSGGAYFVTAVTHTRECLFGRIADDELSLNEYGEIALECWLNIPTHCPQADLDAFIVMPNHIHGILVLVDDTAKFSDTLAQERFGKPVAGSLPTIVRLYKAGVTRRINEMRDGAGMPIWQRNYYEHIIRDDEALNRIRAYIVSNPARWGQIRSNNPS